MSDDEFIKFEITDEDLASEFAPYRARRLTKNQQIYGIWADKYEDESDEEDTRSAKYSKGNKNYTAPVNFIAGGVHQPGKQEIETTNKENKDEKDDVEILTSDSSEEEMFRPSFFPKAINESEMAGFRKKGYSARNNLAMQKGLGNWEAHTKGVGSKIMLKLGYQPGKGLGKELQGIDAPIEAHLRKGRGAIGAYGPEKKQKKMKVDSGKNEVENDKSRKSDRTSLWRKEKSESNKKIGYVYKSIDDVLEESKKPGKRKAEISECSKVMVIDMTGPEQRVLSGYHAIAGVQKPVDEWEVRKDKKFSNFSMPELLHNLNLLVDVSEQAIVENDRKLKYADDRMKVLSDQVKNLNRSLKQESIMIENWKKMVKRVESVVHLSSTKSLTLGHAEEVFSSLKEEHFTEFCAYEMPILVVNIVRPLLKAFLEEWKPLEDPKKPVAEFIKWRNILNIEESVQPVNAYVNPYHKLVWDSWVPRIRMAASFWESRQWSPMYDLITNWIPLISKWILENILQDVVLRRIQQQVDEWNPLTDHVPIHTWILPWLNFLSKHFETSVYPTIRLKLSKALISWHPSDSSALLMLRPWVGVFEQGEMDAFLVNNIVPKLQIVLQEFIINPHQQSLVNWKWVMDWSEVIQAHTMAALLDRFFFPKWLQTLSVWLNMNPDFDQVSKWFTGWKTMIPDGIKSQPVIVDHLRTALELMNKSIGGGDTAPVIERPKRVEDTIEVVRGIEAPVSLKSMVQSRCEEKGILWIPIPNRFMEAKQVYKCGKLQVYFDRNVLFVSQGGGSFIPMSWQEMLEIAV